MNEPNNGEQSREEMQDRIEDLEAQVAADRKVIDHLEAEGLVDRDTITNLEAALVTARGIGAAMGVLMCRHVLTEPQAFDLLREASQRQHRKVRDLADYVVLAGDLPSH
jgi:uncharacterized coiled-coil protein SlyX